MKQVARITGIATAYPSYELKFDTAPDLLGQLFPRLSTRMSDVVTTSQIFARQLVQPPEWYISAAPGELAQEYARSARFLAERAAWGALLGQDVERATSDRTWDVLKAAGPQTIDAIVTVSTTGTVVPSLAAGLLNDLGCRRDTVQLPIYGYGCAGGALGLARALDMVRAGYRRVLLVAVELCSTSLLRTDQSPNNYVAASLFGDGAAAVVLEAVAEGEGGPRVLHHGGGMWPDSEDVMRFDAVDGGHRVQFGQELPTLLRERLAFVVEEACLSWGWTWNEVQHLIAHTGGPKVLQAIYDALHPLPGEGLTDSWAELEEHGNTSSVSVLAALERTMQRGAKGRALLLGMGPGFNVSCVGLEL